MLSNNQKTVLKNLYPNKTINENDFKTVFGSRSKDKTFAKLFSDKYLHSDTSELYAPAIISLTEKGRAYVENIITETHNKRMRLIHDWVNTAIALLALIVAIMK